MSVASILAGVAVAISLISVVFTGLTYRRGGRRLVVHAELLEKANDAIYVRVRVINAGESPQTLLFVDLESRWGTLRIHKEAEAPTVLAQHGGSAELLIPLGEIAQTFGSRVRRTRWEVTTLTSRKPARSRVSPQIYR